MIRRPARFRPSQSVLWLLFLCSAPAAAAAQVASPSGAIAPAPRVSRYVQVPFDYAALVPPPSAKGSPAAQSDLQAVLSAQAQRTPQQIAKAQQDDAMESMFLFADVLGPGFDASALPLTSALSAHLRAESGVVNPALKLAFHRDRPFVVDTAVHPVCKATASNSYPSGHAMVDYLEAMALLQMVPEKSVAILRRAAEYAHNRVVCGVHFPSDLEASHTVALVLFGEIAASPAFEQELTAARAELRTHLHLPNDLSAAPVWSAGGPRR